jgi:mannose-6-phosphate isomerase-like protein (cupin superfamily)
MYLIRRAGVYTPPDGGEANHWILHLNSNDLSLGTYSIPAGGLDTQEPHTEDEVYVVQAGRATLETASDTVPVEPGSVVFVPAGEAHKFTDITEDLTLVVVFAPRFGSRGPGRSDLFIPTGRRRLPRCPDGPGHRRARSLRRPRGPSPTAS